jgi:hypothetical protein
MPSIAEQIHAYYALKAQEGEAARSHTVVLPSVPAKPADYFRLLMDRWQNDYVRNILTRRQNHQ